MPRDADQSGGGKKKKVRVDLRRNRGKVARDKGAWTRGFHSQADGAHDAAGGESTRGKGSLSRKRTITVGEDEKPVEGVSLQSGMIVAVRGLIAEVDGPTHRWNCTVRRVLWSRLMSERQPLAVGDRVRFLPGLSGDATNEGVIEHVEPRQTTLTRQYEDRMQVLAANVDQALIIAAADEPTLRPHLIDRFLVAAHKGGMKPIIVINKIDLRADDFIEDVVARYDEIGYTILPISVVKKAGIAEVREVMKGQTSVLVGISGVGKSSILNAVDPEMKLRVGEVGEQSRRGKHTTTVAVLLKLSFGGYVVDTPGMRQFELAHVPAEEVEAYFIEFRELIGKCKYHGCRHITEDGCAIRAAAEADEIHPERYASYVKMMTERMAGEKR